MMTKDIGDVLISQINGLEWQKNIFMGVISDDLSKALIESIQLTQSGMDASPSTWDGEILRLSVEVKWNIGEKGMEESYSMIENIKSILHLKKDFISNSTHYTCVTAVSGPYHAGNDSRNRPIWKVDFQVIKGLDGEA